MTPPKHVRDPANTSRLQTQPYNPITGSHHPPPPIPKTHGVRCDICLITYSSKEDNAIHFTTHFSPLFCDKCPQRVVLHGQESLEIHMMHHERGKKPPAAARSWGARGTLVGEMKNRFNLQIRMSRLALCGRLRAPSLASVDKNIDKNLLGGFQAAVRPWESLVCGECWEFWPGPEWFLDGVLHACVKKCSKPVDRTRLEMLVQGFENVELSEDGWF